MPSVKAGLLAAVALTAAGSAPGADLPPVPPPPPPDIRALLAGVRRGEHTPAVILTARDDAAPYLRADAAYAPDDRYRAELRRAVAVIEARTPARNRARFSEWAAGRRIDLCVELLAGWADKDEAVRMTDELLAVLHAIKDEANARLPQKDGRIPGVILPQPFVQPGGPVGAHLAGEEVVLRADGRGFTYSGRASIRSDRLATAHGDPTGCVVAVRSRVTYVGNNSSHDWYQCAVLVNAPMTLRATSHSLVVCDGDLEFEGLSVQSSVVIANGVIRERRAPGSTLVYDAKSLDRAFGVRFLDPREFGVEAEPAAGGMRVAAVAAWSPLATAGVRAGDTVTRMNGRPVATPHALRQELRRAIVLESAVVNVVRGGKPAAFVAYFDGVPAPPHFAPAPRPAGR